MNGIHSQGKESMRHTGCRVFGMGENEMEEKMARFSAAAGHTARYATTVFHFVLEIRNLGGRGAAGRSPENRGSRQGGTPELGTRQPRLSQHIPGLVKRNWQQPKLPTRSP